jgi:hypothetical protein
MDWNKITDIGATVAVWAWSIVAMEVIVVLTWAACIWL